MEVSILGNIGRMEKTMETTMGMIGHMFRGLYGVQG